MRHSRIAIVLLLAGPVASARAQILPTPPTAIVVNFDDIEGAPSDVGTPVPLLDPTRYANLGVIIAGFGNSGGVVLNLGNGGAGAPTPAISPPNALTFAGIGQTTEGGLIASPETLTFNPPVTSLQFDVTTVGIDCAVQEVLQVDAFAPGGASLGSQSVTLPHVSFEPDAPPQGITIVSNFPAPGAERVVVTAPQQCALTPQLQLEAWTMDNVAFIATGSGVGSKCTQGILDAAGKKAKAQASCYAKALGAGVAVDPACLQKASDNFTKGFTKAQDKGDCQTDFDVASTESAVDTLLTDTIGLVTGGSPGPDVCFNKKMTSIGKKAQAIAKCYSKAAKSGAAADPACADKAANSFNSALKKCGTPTQLGPVEAAIDQFGAVLNRNVTVPTTTSTTTTTSTSTTTTAPPLGPHLSFTTVLGTADCSFNPGGDPPGPTPASGALYSDTAATTLITNLGLGCLNIGGGAALIPPSRIPENATNILDSPDGTTLVASFGTGQRDCSRGPEATKHCIGDPTIECTDDSECGNRAGGCAFDANCFFGPPVEVNGFPTTCVVNTFAADGSGTVDLATGTSNISIDLLSRVYLSLGQPTPCPHCDGGFCNWGDRAGLECTTDNSQLTTLDCPPSAGVFVGAIPVNLTPLTTGSTTVTAADGIFCPDQVNAGAFGEETAQAITQTGSPGGDLSDGQPHASVLVSNFCIPKTGSPAVDGVADLPGPGSLSLAGNAQYFSSPSGAFLDN
jgi:hypothetical protein